MIGVVGLGNMGSNLVRCLRSRGLEVSVYNRTKSRAEELCREVKFGSERYSQLFLFSNTFFIPSYLVPAPSGFIVHCGGA